MGEAPKPVLDPNRGEIRKPKRVEPIPGDVINKINDLNERLRKAKVSTNIEQDRKRKKERILFNLPLPEYLASVALSDTDEIDLKFRQINHDWENKYAEARKGGDPYLIERVLSERPDPDKYFAPYKESYDRKFVENQQMNKDAKELPLEIHKLLDTLSEGRYLDTRNVSHVVGAYNNRHTEWTPQERLDSKLMSGGLFWYSINGNTYAIGQDKLKLCIFSPKNKFLLKYLSLLAQDVGGNIAGLKDFLNGRNISIHNDEEVASPVNWGAVTIQNPDGEIGQKFQDNDPRLPRWSDIADCIIDLEAKTVSFYSNEEKK